MDGILEKLFGSSSRVKIIRLFLFNPEVLFTLGIISRRTKVALPSVRREVALLKSVNLIKQKEVVVTNVVKLKKGKIKNNKKKVQGITLNPSFPFLQAFRNLILSAAPIDKKKLIKDINEVGRIKLMILSGIFTQNNNSRTDLFLVGNSIKEGKLDRVVKNVEAEIGREIVYAILSTDDFLYRLGMYDRFVRDVLDYPHETIINKLNI
jgi:chitinase